MNCRAYQGRNARSRKRQRASIAPVTIEDRKRALEEARRELEMLRKGIRTAAIEIRAVEADPGTTDEQALVLNAHLALLLAQEQWMSRVFERAESQLAALDPPGTTPIAGTKLPL